MSEELRPFPPVLQPGPRLDLLEGLRSYAAEFAELARHSARHLNLHTTDANALVEVLVAERGGEPLSPARLAERVALTSGATNALVNRLEKAGYVVRSREHTDRRQVSLRSTELARTRTEALYTRPSVLLDQALDRIDPRTIMEMTAALQVLAGALNRINRELGTPEWQDAPESAKKMF
ncbi:MarR family winged helix-turn-helix transcriptional regulator [Kineosporia babensis]|uniref:MarR family transcriptional regulator n=1 Tax=Kineosporia babensis TaxID=499548 RepID=A0A9X1SUS4_9ACTN|nr:MarR family transcriptional regulator [Kineosporia babensis]MCD5313272.1 MarR family transcriptional regulator [Kineosporia babensis]